MRRLMCWLGFHYFKLTCGCKNYTITHAYCKYCGVCGLDTIKGVDVNEWRRKC
jgi:hypothetical protein